MAEEEYTVEEQFWADLTFRLQQDFESTSKEGFE